MKKILLLLLCLLLCACSNEADEVGYTRTVKTEFILGTQIEIVLGDHATDEAFEAIFERLREIETMMSSTIPESDIYQLNRAQGKPFTVHEDTYEVIESAVKYQQESGGFFDASMGRVTELWQISSDEPYFPTPEEVQEALLHVDGSKIQLLGNNRVQIEEGMNLDLGGIAKGYAADQLLSIASEHNIHAAIFNLGGDVVVKGNKEGAPFVLGIQDPLSDKHGEPLGSLPAEDQTLVTSGDYERFFIGPDGKTYHHIFDYRTGYPATNELASVSILTKHAMDADALSTAIYAMGLEEGLRFAEARDDMEAILITHEREIYLTSGVKDSFELFNTTYTIKE